MRKNKEIVKEMSKDEWQDLLFFLRINSHYEPETLEEARKQLQEDGAEGIRNWRKEYWISHGHLIPRGTPFIPKRILGYLVDINGMPIKHPREQKPSKP
jgi:hypothetical protein